MSAERETKITSIKFLLLKDGSDNVPQMISISEASTDIKDFIINKRIGLEKELLEKEKASVIDKEKPHKRKRSKKETRDIRKAQQREKDKIGSQIRKLEFKNNSPLVLELNGKGKIIECSVASDHGDIQWINFVKENKDLLKMGKRGKELVYKALVFRVDAQQGEPGAQEKYFDLIKNEIGERRDLDPYLKKITEKYGEKKVNF